VRQHHADTELAQFGKHVGDAQGGEVLELVDVDEERPPLLLGRVRAAMRGKSTRGSSRLPMSSSGKRLKWNAM
jgi:hypothetical protein